MAGITVASVVPGSDWSFAEVIERNGDFLTVKELGLINRAEAKTFTVRISEVREIKKITFGCLVVPRKESAPRGWEIGKVIGMSCLDLSIGPLLHIRDIITGEEVRAFPFAVDKLVRDQSTQFV
jgi:hypothetical protein